MAESHWSDIWFVDLGSERAHPEPFLATAASEQSRSLSPERAGKHRDDLRVVPRWAETIQGVKDSG